MDHRALTPLDRRTVIDLLAAIGVPMRSGGRAVRMPGGNEVLRLETEPGTLYYLKCPTKDLEAWPTALHGAAEKVARERAAAECLRRWGLPAPEVVAADVGWENAIGRPYLLTRRVAGRPFTTVVPRRTRQGWKGPLRAVGAFLAAVHRIEFRAAGYVTTADGPLGPTAPAPLLPSHAAGAAQGAALRDLAQARPFLHPSLAAKLAARFGALATSIEGDYHPPRLLIGGFHPNHPFLARVDGRWSVVGLVDLETTSGGRTVDDLVTFAVGMMFRFDRDVSWWEPLFEGYGAEPALEVFRDELLASCCYWFGASSNLGATYEALLAAGSWATLFDVHRPR
jgi:hypothetical protein